MPAVDVSPIASETRAAYGITPERAATLSVHAWIYVYAQAVVYFVTAAYSAITAQ